MHSRQPNAAGASGKSSHVGLLHAALRANAAATYLGVSRSQLWRKAKNDPSWPQPRKLGPRITVWMKADLDAFLAQCEG